MTDKPARPSQDAAKTLTDDDIVSKPSRRALLASLGIGAGAAIAASVVAMTPTEAADAGDKKAPAKKKPAKKPAKKAPETDHD